MNKCVFLDRDGIINESLVVDGKPIAPGKLSDLVLVEDIEGPLKALKDLGYYLIIITNQPDVARKKIKKQAVLDINNQISQMMPIDDIFVCFHDNNDMCDCRKPKPGNIFRAQEKYKIELSESYMIGDRETDILAGKAANLKTIFVDYNYNEKKPDDYDYLAYSPAEAIKIILNLQRDVK